MLDKDAALGLQLDIATTALQRPNTSMYRCSQPVELFVCSFCIPAARAVRLLARTQMLGIPLPHDDALVETVTECELLQATGQAHVLEALVETVTECELLQATGQAHVLHALVETVTECELLQATGQAHVLQTGAGDQELTTTRPNACQVKKLEPSKTKHAVVYRMISYRKVRGVPDRTPYQ